MHKSLKVFAPASVANVAVGYDILGFAIEGPGDEIVVKKSKTPGLKITKITGANNKLPFEIMKNTAGVAAHNLLKFLGEENAPIDMEIRKKMPFGSGLGSSAASAVAGVFAINEIMRTGLSKREILRFAVEGEQVADGSYHADNVAPSLLGGMTLIRDNATLDVKKLHIPQGMTAAVIYPNIEILTRDSRNILKPDLSLETHIAQSGNLASFVAGMYTSDFGLMKRSLQDVLIEPQRAQLIPYFQEVKEAAYQEDILGFSISGAGPSMFALTMNTLSAEKVIERIKAIYQQHKIRVKTYVSPINQEGAFRF